MSKARTLANLISDNAELADGQISVAEVVGAAPLANPTFTGTVTTDAVTMNGNTTIGNSSTDTLTVRATTTFTNIGTGAAAGPYVNLLRDSSSPADDDFIGILSWQGKNDADQTVTYGQIAGRIADASDGSEDARIDLQGIVAGTTRSIMQYESGLTQFNAAGQDIDFKVHSTGNTNSIFMNAGNGTTAFGTTTDNYNHASNEGIYLSPGSSSSFTANGPPIRVNRNGTGGNDRSNVEFYNNGAIRGWIGSLGAEDGIFLYANGSRGMHLYSDEMVVNQDSHDYDFRVESNNATHMFYVDSTNGRIGINTNTPAHMLNLAGTGDVGIHIQGDTDNYVENDNPYLSMSQDGSSAQQLKIGMVGDAGQEFNDSVANAAFIHANNASDQPFQIAHFGDAVVDFYRTGTVFNQAGRDQDFRVETDSINDAFEIDASQDVIKFKTNVWQHAPLTGNFAGGWVTVTNLDTLSNLISNSAAKIRVYANENGRTNVSYSEHIAVRTNGTWVLQQLAEVTSGNSHGNANIQMSGTNLQIRNGASSSIGAWKVSLELFR